MLLQRTCTRSGKVAPCCRHLQTVFAEDTKKKKPPRSHHLIPTAEPKETLSNPKLEKLVKRGFPKSRFCFAYGSKVLHQRDNLPTASTMTDLIFVVKDSHSWHASNFAQNKAHYSPLMRLLGPRVVATLQDNFSAHCYFNPYVEVEGVLLKYGVINESKLLRDLQHWDTLYVAGRLHKPVLVLQKDPAFRADSYINLNLRSALHTALTLLPDRFNDFQLFSIISRISYFGDIRMKLKAENPSKVRNIVEPNIPHFRELYRTIIDESPFIERTDYGYIQATKSEKNLQEMERYLPRKLLHLPEGNINPKSRVMLFDKNVDPKSQLLRKVAAGDIRFIEESLRKIVMWPSLYQALKGFLTAGPAKSLKYSVSKMTKARGKPDKKSEVPAVVSKEKKEKEQLMTSEYTDYNTKVSHDPVRSPTDRRILLVILAMFGILQLYLTSQENSLASMEQQTTGLQSLYSEKKKRYDAELERLKAEKLQRALMEK